jgi:glycine cleavage system regulatory protein
MAVEVPESQNTRDLREALEAKADQLVIDVALLPA